MPKSKTPKHPPTTIPDTPSQEPTPTPPTASKLEPFQISTTPLPDIIELDEAFNKHPHDTMFKIGMDHRNISIPYIKANLPKEIVKLCDFDKIEMEKTDFLDEYFSDKRSDVLLKIPYKNKNDAVYIYILSEAQRKDDPCMAWRLLQYMVAIWQYIERKRQRIRLQEKADGIPEKERTPLYPLPTIFPIVLYNGKRKWKSPTNLQDSLVLAYPKHLQKFMPQLTFHLEDLTQSDLQKYIRDEDCQRFMTIFQNAHPGKIAKTMENMVDYFQEPTEEKLYIIRAYIAYMCQLTAKTEEQTEIIDILTNNMKQNKDPNMTSTIELIYGKKIEDFKKEAEEIGVRKGKLEGKIEGKIEGEQIGLTKGKIESQQESARNLLHLGVSAEIISQAVGIPYDEVLAMQQALSPSPDYSPTK